MIMNVDPLGKLLRDVDAAQPLRGSSRSSSDDLVAQVRRRARRQVQARRAAAAAALLVAIGGAVVWHASLPSSPSKVIVLATSPTTAIAPAPVDTAQLQRELARLNAEAELHQQTAIRILARERAAAAAPVVAAPDANQALTAQVERSALTMVNRGNSLLHVPGAKAEAAESFKRVLELFPQSQAAAMARQRLDQIGA
jgi:hypothetical protein